MINAQPGIGLGEWDTETSLGFWATNGSPNLGRTTMPSDNQQINKKTPKESAE